MTHSVSAWLQHKIDDYHHLLRDMTIDFWLAQTRLNRADCTLANLRTFNDACLAMAETCQRNGDDQSYLHALGQLCHRLVQEMGNGERERLFRIQAYQLARPSLARLCQQLTLAGEWEKAETLQRDFIRHAGWIF